jgi:hypothetical protein
VDTEPAVTGFLLSNRPYLEDLVAILVVGMLVKYAGTLAATASSQTSNPNIFHLGDTGATRPCAMED